MTRIRCAIRWLFSRRRRIEFLYALLDRAAHNHYVAINMQLTDEHLIQIDMIDRRDGTPYGRVLYVPAEARALAGNLAHFADVADLRQQGRHSKVDIQGWVEEG